MIQSWCGLRASLVVLETTLEHVGLSWAILEAILGCPRPPLEAHCAIVDAPAPRRLPPRPGRRGLERKASYTTYALKGWWDGGRKCWPSWTPNSDLFGYGCTCYAVQSMWCNAHGGS
eukprot:7924512-Pyramimonas_sp.AAC.2